MPGSHAGICEELRRYRRLLPAKVAMLAVSL